MAVANGPGAGVADFTKSDDGYGAATAGVDAVGHSGRVGRIAELDGLRGVAALSVVVAHYLGEVPHGFSFLMLGWYGVSFFFVLSGFLMGTIILKHHAEPKFLRSFYLRRAARIIPVYFVVVCVTVLLAALTTGHVWSDHPFDVRVYLLFLTNFAISMGGDGGAWLRPTWTLAVEEQFYLLLPLLVIWTRKRFLVAMLLALYIAAIAFRYAACDTDRMAALLLLPGRMDLLLGGVILAYAMRRFDLSPYLQIFRIVPLLAMVPLLIMAAASRNHLFVVLNPTLMSVAFVSFLLAVLLGAREGRRYRSRVLGYFGRISYALYLVHQPIAGLLHGLLLQGKPDIATIPQIMVTALAFAMSVAVASASWTWLEQPILRWVPGRAPDPVQRSPTAQAT
jgi:peptidoglycan/LPS O-acetylase OafA/YrhL